MIADSRPIDTIPENTVQVANDCTIVARREMLRPSPPADAATALTPTCFDQFFSTARPSAAASTTDPVTTPNTVRRGSDAAETVGSCESE